MIRILHSADWHLGQTLQGWNREAEHVDALAALVEIAVARDIDALIVAGDVYDTQNPSERAEKLLFDTLLTLRARLPHLVMIVLAGNHDPAGRIEAPHSLFRQLGVHVVGRIARKDGAIDFDRHLVAIPARDGGESVHVLALPYLGPAALPPIDRRGEAPGSPVVRVVRAFHDEVVATARARIGAAALVVTGHLAVAGATESEGAERRILIGGEHAVPSDLFPEDVAYVALGHLHRPQAIGRETLRYSGSLFPLSATERDYEHGVSLVTIDGGATTVEHVPIARPVPFLRVPPRGALGLDALEAALAALGLDPEVPVERRPFVQLSVRLDGPTPGLKAKLDRLTADLPLRFVGHQVERPASEPAASILTEPQIDLADRDPEDLFRLAFEAAHGVPPTPAHLGAFALAREKV